MSFSQVFVDWFDIGQSGFFEDLNYAKFFLAIVCIFYDMVFLGQHYILYKANDKRNRGEYVTPEINDKRNKNYRGNSLESEPNTKGMFLFDGFLFMGFRKFG